MHRHQPRTGMRVAARVTGTLLAAVLASGCGTADVASPSTTSPAASPAPAPTAPARPAPAATATPEPAVLGTITVTETGCALDDSPDRIEPGRFILDVHNGTRARAAFDMFRIGESGSVEAFVAHVEDERTRAEAGEPFRGPPIWAHHVVGSDLLERGESATLAGTAELGTYAVVCLWKFETTSSDPVRPFALVGPIGVGETAQAFTEADVDGIVLSEADAPAGASYLGTDAGREVLLNPVWYLSTTEQQRFRALPGFVHAAASSYRLGSSSADPLFVSEAMLFDDADSAADAMAAYVAEWQASFGFVDPTPSSVELGDGGLLFSGPAAVQGGEPGFYYFWRSNNLLLNMVAVGPAEGAALDAMESTVRAMALEMDRRSSRP